MASTTVPPLMTTDGGLRRDKVNPRSEEQIEDRHANGDPVGDLAGDYRRRVVGNLGGDLDPAVDRSRVHDQGLIAELLASLSGEPIAGGVFANGGKQRFGHAFSLEPQEVDDVEFRQDRVEIV